MDKIYILDTTLRDGAQCDGISYSANDKINIVKALDEIGIDFIEAGSPSFYPKDRETFKMLGNADIKNSRITAFTSTRRKNTDINKDKNCREVAEFNTPAVCLFGKSSEYQTKVILKTTPEENLKMIEESCAFFKEKGRTVIFDAEHFYDGYKENKDYAMKTLSCAAKGKADYITLCDTNGSCFPDDIEKITKDVVEEFRDENIIIGIHAHNDMGLAVANSLAAVSAGAKMVQGTFIGIGERTGNANLSTIIPDLQIKLGYSCIPEDKLTKLTETAMRIAEISNISLHKNLPFVGRNAFTHKAGTHVDAVMKDSKSFELIDPETVGNKRRILSSEMMGKAAVFNRVSKIYPDVEKDAEEIESILDEIKEKENKGYCFEGAEGSINIIIRKHMKDYIKFFELLSYETQDIYPAKNDLTAKATIKLRVNKRSKTASSYGKGPINALDSALRKALSSVYPALNDVHLIDFKMRVIDSEENTATASKVRVLITSTDGQDVWTTIGVSKDMIKAGFIALSDSVEYKLMNGVK